MAGGKRGHGSDGCWRRWKCDKARLQRGTCNAGEILREVCGAIKIDPNNLGECENEPDICIPGCARHCPLRAARAPLYTHTHTHTHTYQHCLLRKNWHCLEQWAGSNEMGFIAGSCPAKAGSLFRRKCKRMSQRFHQITSSKICRVLDRPCPTTDFSPRDGQVEEIREWEDDPSEHSRITVTLVRDHNWHPHQ